MGMESDAMRQDGGIEMSGLTISTEWLQAQFPDYSNIVPLVQPGGQKQVYRAQHRSDGNVVLKIVHLDTEPERIEREVIAVQQIGSSRIPRIMEYGNIAVDDNALLWIREEHISGQNLRQALSSGPLNPQAVLALGFHILEALAEAENVRIVHRDVKPENIMVGTNGNFYLLDFGISRHLDLEALTAKVGGGLGTPGYMPPEQYRNRQSEIDGRTDLFALGVTLYEAIEGRNPFLYARFGEVERMIETQPLPKVVRADENTSGLAELIFSMTRSRKDHRPSSVRDALDWLQEIRNPSSE